jgi:hypothetical protein
MGYQPINNTVNDMKGNLIANSHTILATWRNNLPQILNYMGLMMLGKLKYIQ